MGQIEELQKELKALQKKRDDEKKINQLKKQIKYEKFAKTKTGKIFNKIVDVGEAGYRTGKKFLSAPPQQKGGKNSAPRRSVQDILNSLPQ